ncbi:MAG: hypothetical protein IJU42_08035 [Erysipelotrichaceae bacterium]|jgi:hypothetical protein|nr:hypothetical protein [Erysipelotrichaceae bacterium]
MEIMFFVSMFALLAYVTYRNVQLISRYRHNKEYIECYKQMLNQSESAYERTCNYIANEKSEEFRNKGRVLKLYQQLGRNEDCTDTLEALDFREIFYRKGKYSKQQLLMSSDIFVWIYLVLARARKLSKFDVLNGVYDKFIELDQMNNRVEYQLTKAIYNALCEKEDAGVEFLSSLLDGGFASYEYEKSLIGLFKRFAAATLAYSGEPMEDYYKEDLHGFAATQIGKAYMNDLEIFEKYLPKTETESEDPLKENEEK